jgi:hypothetical protein
MWKDVAPWLLGPAGILLGWWLNQRTLQGSAEREAKRADEAAERQRVVDALRLGRDTASLVRSLLHGIYLKAQYGSPPKGLDEMMNEFNKVRDEFRNSVLALRILGPSWAVQGAEQLDVEMNKLAELAFIMQKGVKAEHMTSVNSGLPELDRMLRGYIADVSKRYNVVPSALPPQRAMDTEGRWKPIEG